MACKVCEDKGWLKVTVYNSQYVPDGRVRVERCDACMKLRDDEEAIKVAEQDGVVFCEECGSEIPVGTTHHCGIIPRVVRD